MTEKVGEAITKETNPPREDEILFQNYLVVFIDIIGQRSGLRKITSLPTNEAEKEEFIHKLKGTYGTVTTIRNAFKTFFEGSRAHVPDTSLVPAEQRDALIATQKSEEYFYGFSDSIIIAVPLASNDENCTAVNGIYFTLIATCGIGLISLASKIMLRGGLDVGVAAQIEDKEIYGPALERAYYLESNLAEYPRFVVGNELISYLQWVMKLQCKSIFGAQAKQMAKLCSEMIKQDDDGRYVLDFMGKRARESADNSINAEVVKSAIDFVRERYHRYLNDNDYKLSSRYFRLLRYLVRHAEEWGVGSNS